MDISPTQIKETTDFLRQKGFDKASTAIIMGTGLGSFVEQVKVVQALSYNDIPHFPAATVEFHKGQLLLAETGGTNVLVMQGRFHYYEGYSMQQVTFPVRVMKELGIKTLFISNAAGGMNPDFKKGDLVLLTDHINMQPENPLRGSHHTSYGDRFPDMSQPYNKELNEHLLNAAAQLSVPLKQGVYVAVQGPNLETKAEYRFLRMMGADMVGMSTVPEVIVANQAGIRCAAISVITDECDPDHLQPVNIEEIIAVAGVGDKLLSKVLKLTVEQLAVNN